MPLPINPKQNVKIMPIECAERHPVTDTETLQLGLHRFSLENFERITCRTKRAWLKITDWPGDFPRIAVPVATAHALLGIVD